MRTITFKVERLVMVTDLDERDFILLYTIDNEGSRPDPVELQEYIQEWFDEAITDMAEQVQTRWRELLQLDISEQEI